MSNDEATALFNGYYAEKSEDFLLVGATFDDHYVLDLVVEWTPADDLLLWADLTHATAEVANGGAEPTISGIALGGRMGVTDRLGLGGRFEYAKVDLDIGGDDESDRARRRPVEGDQWSLHLSVGLIGRLVASFRLPCPPLHVRPPASLPCTTPSNPTPMRAACGLPSW